MKIVRIIDPALYLRIINIKVPLNQYLMAQLELAKRRSLIRAEEEEYFWALSILEFGNAKEEEEREIEPLPL